MLAASVRAARRPPEHELPVQAHIDQRTTQLLAGGLPPHRRAPRHSARYAGHLWLPVRRCGNVAHQHQFPATRGRSLHTRRLRRAHSVLSQQSLPHHPDPSNAWDPAPTTPPTSACDALGHGSTSAGAAGALCLRHGGVSRHSLHQAHRCGMTEPRPTRCRRSPCRPPLLQSRKWGRTAAAPQQQSQATCSGPLLRVSPLQDRKLALAAYPWMVACCQGLRGSIRPCQRGTSAGTRAGVQTCARGSSRQRGCPKAVAASSAASSP